MNACTETLVTERRSSAGQRMGTGLSDLGAESVRARARAERMCVARAVRRARSWSKGSAHGA